MSAKYLPYAPWATPRERVVARGVTVETTYGYHLLAAVVYGIWRKLRGDKFWRVSRGSSGRNT